MVEKAIREILTSDPAITAIVGSRVYQDFARQGTILPYLVFGRASTYREYALSGYVGLAQARIEVTMIGETFGSLVLLAKEVREALTSFHGTKKGVRIQDAILDDEWSSAETQVTGGDFAVYRRNMDYLVWFEESPVGMHT